MSSREGEKGKGEAVGDVHGAEEVLDRLHGRMVALAPELQIAADTRHRQPQTTSNAGDTELRYQPKEVEDDVAVSSADDGSYDRYNDDDL